MAVTKRFLAVVHITVALVFSVATSLSAQSGPMRAEVPPGASSSQRMAPERAVGKTVRVSFVDGKKRKAELVALTATELVVRTADDVAGAVSETSYPIAEVRKVEVASHRAVKYGLIAAVGAVGSALLLGEKDADCSGECGVFIFLLGGIAAGTGAAIGALVDHATAPGRVVYAAPARAVQIAPFATPTRVGVRVLVRW